MELLQNIDNNVSTDLNLEKKQNNFLQTTTWKLIDGALNTGIRALVPNLIENQVIEIKDQIIKNGFKAGVNQSVKAAIDLGKSAQGIFTGKFENIGQAQTVIKNGGIIDSVSNLLNFTVNKCVKNNLIPQNIGSIILKGKDVILNTVESNIENSFQTQLSAVSRLEKYTKNWKNYFTGKDFEGMEKEFKKMKETMKEIMPIQNTINEVKKVENLHLLIKNNGKNFNLTSEEIELAKQLI